MENSQTGYRIKVVGVIVVAALAVLPFILAQFGKTGEFWIWVTTEMIIMALYATSLNLVLGFGGMVSFGHAAFFGVGAYTVALLMKKAGVSLVLSMFAAPLVAGITAAVVGWFCVRLIGLYFAILTLAFGQLLYMIAFQWYTFTGGDDGIHGIPKPEFLDPTNYYILCLIIFLICFLIMRMIVNSSFGLTIRLTRENLDRAKFIGINVRRYQLINWSRSGDAIFACLVGGMYSFVGPAIGSTILIFLHIILQQIHQSLVEIWAIILGIILLGVVLFAPEGLVGLYLKLTRKSEI
jgi:branched-chain amino acid transport system permease protein